MTSGGGIRSPNRPAFARMLAPRHIAICGASARTSNMGRRFLLRAMESTARVTAVHPTAEVLPGATVRSIKHLREACDVVVIATPPTISLEILRDLAGADVACVVIASALDDGPEARSIVSQVGTTGTIVLGPMSNGYVSASGRLTLTSNPSTTAASVEGCVLLGESGAMVLSAVWSALHERGLRVRFAACTGEQWRTSWPALADAAIRDLAPWFVGVAMEQVSSWTALHSIALAARAIDCKVSLLHLGRSSMGGGVAASHSGALGTSEALTRDACRQAGLIYEDSVRSLVDTAEVAFNHSILGTRVDRGMRPLLLSTSGGALAYLADRLPVAAYPPLDVDAVGQLRDLIDVGVSPRNPMDLGAALATDHSRAMRVLATLCDSGTDADRIIVGCAAPSQFVGLARELLADDRRLRLPVEFALIYGSAGHDGRELAELRAALGRRACMVWTTLNGYWSASPPRRAAPRQETRAVLSASTVMTEARASEVVRRLGVARPEEFYVSHDEDGDWPDLTAVANWTEGWFAKGMSPAVTHKLKAGLLLNSRECASPKLAAEELARRARVSGTVLEGILFQRAVAFEGPELIIASRRDPVLGPYVMVGLGGTNVEATRAVRNLFPPFDENVVASALAEIVPQGPSFAAMAELIVGLHEVASAILAPCAAGTVRAIELNPVVLERSTGRWVALDCLIEE